MSSPWHQEVSSGTHATLDDTDGAVDPRLNCAHDRSHIVDSRFHGGGYASNVSRRIFCDVCRLQRWLDIEVTLVQCQAELGMVPAESAARIAKLARIDLLDLDEIRDGVQRTGHSLVPLLNAFERVCGGFAGQFLHHGATTQDIQDTGMTLEMRDVLDAINTGVLSVLRRLGRLAAEHRDHIMMGRTHAQPALPMTFGLKVAGWIDELLRQRKRMEESRARILVVQLFGGVGTMAGFGPDGPRLVEKFARKLGLGVPALGWHVSRDRVAEYVTNLAMLTATLARIADEVRTLGRPEFQELEEHWETVQIGSSTMPHKRNPEKCEQVVVLARLARAQVGLSLEAMILEHERDYRGTRLEWPAVADVSHYTLTALDLLGGIVGGLRIHAERMAGTTNQGAEAACTEAMMLGLGALVGKQRAFKLVHTLSQKAQDRKVSLVEIAKQTPEIASLMDERTLGQIFDPAAHLGSSGVLTDGVLAELERVVATRRPSAHPAAPPGPPRARLQSSPPTRSRPRYNLVLKVDYKWEDEFHFDYLTDLSEGGMRLRTSLPLRPGQRLTVRISFGKLFTPLEIDVEVRWVEPEGEPPMAGVAFVDMSVDTKMRLEALIQAAQPNSHEGKSHFRCLMFERDPVLQQVYLQEVRDLTEYHGHVRFEITNVSTAVDWYSYINRGNFDLAIVDLDDVTNWGDILNTPVPIVLLGSRAARHKLEVLHPANIMFLEKPLRFGLLLHTIGTLLKLEE
jgi:adenylosuccinate lyase